MFINGCKKSDLVPESTVAVKSYDFYATGGDRTNDNGFIIYCNEPFYIFGTLNNKIVKLNSDGQIEWQYYFKPVLINDTIYKYLNVLDIAQTNDGYIASVFQDSSNNSNFHFTSIKYIKFNLSGQIIIERVIDTGTLTNRGNILSLKNGDVLVFNNIISFDTTKFYIYRLSTDGNVLAKSNNHGYKSAVQQLINKMIEAPDGSFVFVGTYGSLVKYNFIGDNISFRRYYVPKSFSYVKNFTNIIATPDNNYLVTGFVNNGLFTTFQYDYVTLKIDQNLDSIFEKTSGTPKQDYCLSSLVTNDNNFALVGITNYASNPNEDYASSISLIKVDNNGNELYSKKLADGLSTKGLLVNQNPDNSFNILGSKLAYGSPGFNHTIFMHIQPE